MKQIKFKYLVILIMLLLFPKIVFGEECTEEELNKLNKETYKIKLDVIHDSDNYFKVKIVNNNELFVIEDHNGRKVSEHKYYSGNNYIIFYYGSETSKCQNKIIRKSSLKIPIFNIFSDDFRCKNIDREEFSGCRKIVAKELTEEEFSRKLKLFLDNKNKKNKTTSKEKEYKKNYYYVGFILFILIIAVIITAIVIKRKMRIKW